MIKIENVEVMGWEAAVRGMRNPMNSWKRSDSYCICEYGPCDSCEHENDGKCAYWGKEYTIGPNDLDLMKKLADAGSVHGKYRRMITVYLDITAPLYWWKEFDTYKVGTVANSCSTMHKIADKEFTLEDFSCEHLGEDVIINGSNLNISMDCLNQTIRVLNTARSWYNDTNDKKYWWQMIQLLPSSYNQKRTVMLNYEVLANIYKFRAGHRLDEWRDFCAWIFTLPYSELITGIDMDVVDKFNSVGNVNPISSDELNGVGGNKQ